MRLGEYILRDMELILQRWELFAFTYVPPAAHMTSLAVRDHLSQILRTIVADLNTSQTRSEQSAKSMGLATAAAGAPHTAAQTHAVLRAASGFSIAQLAAEYRALRASVLSGWLDACLPHPPFVDDIIRFNEAIDQAMAEAIELYSVHINPGAGPAA